MPTHYPPSVFTSPSSIVSRGLQPRSSRRGSLSTYSDEISLRRAPEAREAPQCFDNAFRERKEPDGVAGGVWLLSRFAAPKQQVLLSLYTLFLEIHTPQDCFLSCELQTCFAQDNIQLLAGLVNFFIRERGVNEKHDGGIAQLSGCRQAGCWPPSSIFETTL